MSTLAETPITHTDASNARILAISEDRIQGFVRDPIAEIAARSGVDAETVVERIRASGLTVLIVEQNVRQVLHVVDRAYLLEAGSIRASGAAGELLAGETIHRAYLGV